MNTIRRDDLHLTTYYEFMHIEGNSDRSNPLHASSVQRQHGPVFNLLSESCNQRCRFMTMIHSHHTLGMWVAHHNDFGPNLYFLPGAHSDTRDTNRRLRAQQAPLPFPLWVDPITNEIDFIEQIGY